MKSYSSHESVRVAVVGAGYWGTNLIRNFIASPDFDLALVCDVSEQRLKRVTSIAPSIRTTTRIDDALADDSIDAIAIATPPESHYELSMSAIDAGKHVLVEKPLCTTSNEADEVSARAKQRGLTVMVDHTFLYTGAVEKLKSLVQSGDLGKLLYIDSIRVNLGLIQAESDVLYDLAPHDISIFNYVLGESPVEASAHAAYCTRPNIADVAYMSLKYPSGVLAHVHLSWISPVKVRTVMLAGSSKMAIWDDVEPSEKVRIYDKGVEIAVDPEASERIRVSYRTGDVLIPALDTTEALMKVVADFANSIRTGTEPRSTANIGADVVRILEACHRSLAHNGIFVSI